MKEALNSGADSYEPNKSVAYTYVSKRKCTCQETVYHLMPEFCLRMVFPWVLYADSNIPQKLNRIIFRKKGSFEDKTGIYRRNMVTRFHNRSSNVIIYALCYASLIKRYELHAKQSENNFQPEQLHDEAFEPNHSRFTSYPKMVNPFSKVKLNLL